jgi:threonine dehydrogenase-like Zn-dependent dehydrogenase
MRQVYATATLRASHELPLGDAPKAYKNFDDRTNGWTKVVLKPSAAGRSHRKTASA